MTIVQKKGKYSTALTGAGFMLFEFKQLVQLKEEGLTDGEIREEVLGKNLFQHSKRTSLNRSLPYLLKRVNILDQKLREMVLEDPVDVVKIINFYTILKTDQLFFEFMEEVIYKKLTYEQLFFERRELNLFFSEKMEQDEFLDRLAESTIQRLKQAYVKILEEVGLLVDRKTGELSRLYVEEELKNHLQSIGDGKYIQLLGD